MNRQLAERLLESSSKSKKSGGEGEGGSSLERNPLGDQRFAAMFTNADFEVDEECEEYQRLHPTLSHKEKRREKKEKEAAMAAMAAAAAEDSEVSRGSLFLLGVMHYTLLDLLTRNYVPNINMYNNRCN